MNKQNYIKAELEKLDRLPVKPIKKEILLLQINEQEQLQKEKLVKDVLLFLLAAILLLTGLVTVLLKLSIVFMTLQILVLFLLPLLAILDKGLSKQTGWWD